MLATDAKLQSWLARAAAVDGAVNKFADAALIEAGEWVLVVDFLALIFVVEQLHVVATEAESGLGQVVSTEAEEVA